MELLSPAFIVVDGPSSDQNYRLGAMLFDLIRHVDPSSHVMYEADGWTEYRARAVSEIQPYRTVVFVKAGTQA